MLTPSHQISWKGKTLTLEPPNLATEGLFTDYLCRTAIRDAIRMKGEYGAEFPTALANAQDKSHSGYFEWGGPGWLACLSSDRHFKELVLLIFAQRHNEAEMYSGLLNAMWATPNGKKSADGKSQTYGSEIVEAFWGFMSRKNAPSPAETVAPGEESPSQPTN